MSHTHLYKSILYSCHGEHSSNFISEACSVRDWHCRIRLPFCGVHLVAGKVAEKQNQVKRITLSESYRLTNRYIRVGHNRGSVATSFLGGPVGGSLRVACVGAYGGAVPGDHSRLTMHWNRRPEAYTPLRHTGAAHSER